MKDKFKDKYIYLLDKLHNLHEDKKSNQDQMARFNYLTLYCNMREAHYHVISSFYLGLRSNIQRTIFTSSYHVDFVKEISFSFRMKLTFRDPSYGRSISKARGSVLAVRDMKTMIINAPQRDNILILRLLMTLMI